MKFITVALKTSSYLKSIIRNEYISRYLKVAPTTRKSRNVDCAGVDTSYDVSELCGQDLRKREVKEKMKAPHKGIRLMRVYIII